MIFRSWLVLFVLFVNVSTLPPGILPTVIPLRYDLQLQLPTAAPQDDLIPAFFGSVKIDLQLSRPVFAKYKSPPIEHYPFNFNHFHQHYPKQHGTNPEGAELRLDAVQLSNFDNVTLEGNGRIFEISKIWTENDELVITVTEPALAQGRYSLNIGRYIGIITYTKGIFYR